MIFKIFKIVIIISLKIVIENYEINKYIYLLIKYLLIMKLIKINIF